MTATLPHRWQIHPLTDFETYNIESEDTLGVQMLVRIAPGQLTITHTRWCIFGLTPITFRFDATRLFPFFPDKSLRITLQADVGDMTPQINSTVTPWYDVEQMIREGAALTQNRDKEEVDKKPLLDYLASISADKHCAGGSIRWAVTVTSKKKLRLELQGLPAKGTFLQKESFKRDNVISIYLAGVVLQADLFDGNPFSGPVPLLFAENRDETRKQVDENQKYFLDELAKWSATLLHMEHQEPEDAAKYLKGEGHIID